MSFVNFSGLCFPCSRVITVRKDTLQDKVASHPDTDNKTTSLKPPDKKYKLQIFLDSHSDKDWIYLWEYDSEEARDAAYDELTAKIIAADENIEI